MKFGDKIRVGNNNYTILNFLGKGGFKMAYLGVESDSDRKVVIFKPVEGGQKYFEKEILVLKRFGDKLKWRCIPGLICPLALTLDTIVTNYIPGVDIFTYLQRKIQKQSYPNPDVACKIIYNTLKVMNILQNELSMLHLDVKPENLRINEDLEVGIIDMGLACDFSIPNDCKIRGQGTPLYMAPEMFIPGTLYSDNFGKIDVWSLGCVFYQLLYLRHPLEFLYYSYKNHLPTDSDNMKMIFVYYGLELETIIKRGMSRKEEYIGKMLDTLVEKEYENHDDDVVLKKLNKTILKMLRLNPHNRISLKRAFKEVSEVYELVLEKDEELMIEALSDFDASEVTSFSQLDIEMDIDLDKSMSQNLMDTGEVVVSDNYTQYMDTDKNEEFDYKFKMDTDKSKIQVNPLEEENSMNEINSIEELKWSDEEESDYSDQELKYIEDLVEQQKREEQERQRNKKKRKQIPIVNLYNWLKNKKR